MEKTITLSNGYKIPNLCYGTGILYKYRSWSGKKHSAAKYWLRNLRKNHKQFHRDFRFPKSVDTAMKNGLCMFDTSRAYQGAEYVLGKRLKRYQREEYCIVTKLCNKDQYRGDVRDALQRSLQALGISYVDVYLMHWPVAGVWLDNWKKMEALYREGLCKAIGVCNCNIHHLEELEKVAEIMPMVNQFECHPLLTQDELRGYCREKDIQVMAYTSTARMDERLKKTVLVPLAKKYNKTVAQIILRWHQQIGNIPIVSSSNPKHIEENAHISDIRLSDEEVQKILAININSRLRYDPDNCDFRLL